MKQLELLFATLFSCKAATLKTLLAGSSGILGLWRDYITLGNSKPNSGATLQSHFPFRNWSLGGKKARISWRNSPGGLPVLGRNHGQGRVGNEDPSSPVSDGKDIDVNHPFYGRCGDSEVEVETYRTAVDRRLQRGQKGRLTGPWSNRSDRTAHDHPRWSGELAGFRWPVLQHYPRCVHMQGAEWGLPD